MSKFNPFAWLGDKIRNIDRDDLFKWLCIGGAGLLGFVGGIFDNRSKDRFTRKKIAEEVHDQVSELLTGSTDE